MGVVMVREDSITRSSKEGVGQLDTKKRSTKGM